MELPVGNIKEISFMEIWQNSHFFKNIRDLKIGDFECSGCSHFPTCRPCPGLAFYENGDFFTAPKEICRIVEVFLGKKEGKLNEKEKDLLKAGID